MVYFKGNRRVVGGCSTWSSGVEFNGLISLTETSAFIWRLLEQGHSTDEILKRVLSEYDIDEETARKDMDEFINCGIEKGLFIA